MKYLMAPVLNVFKEHVIYFLLIKDADKTYIKDFRTLRNGSQKRFLNCHSINFATNVCPSYSLAVLIEYVFMICFAILFDLASTKDASR